MNKRNIIIVDDDKSVLDGLRRALRGVDERWNLLPAHSGKEALELLETQSVHAIVSDAMMPVMSGSELLSKVQEQYPHVLRIILSGASDDVMGVKALDVAHQCLSKPCTAEQLKEAVERAEMMHKQQLCNSFKVKVQELGLSQDLEMFHETIREKILEAEGALTSDSEYICSDKELSSQVQDVLAAFPGAPQGLSPRDACKHLGDVIAKALVILYTFESNYGAHCCPQFSKTAFRKDALAVAKATALLAKEDGSSDEMVRDAFTAGFLHNFGTLILAAGKPEEYRQILRKVTMASPAFRDTLEATFGIDHAFLGGVYLHRWGFPIAITEALAYQCQPGKYHAENIRPLVHLHVAQRLYHNHSEEHRDGFDVPYLESMDLAKELPDWTKTLQEKGLVRKCRKMPWNM